MIARQHSCAKGLTAPARAVRIGVREFETSSDECVAVVESHAVDEHQRLGVNYDGKSVEGKLGVGALNLSGVLKFHHVRHSAARREYNNSISLARVTIREESLKTITDDTQRQTGRTGLREDLAGVMEVIVETKSAESILHM